MTLDLYVLMLLTASAISICVFLVVLQKITSQGAVPLAVLLGGISIWAFFQALVFLMDSFELKIVMANMRYFGMQASAIAFYALAREYEDQKRILSPRNWLVVSVFPIICLVALWTDQRFHLFYSKTYLENGYLVLDNGAFFYGNMLYLYIFIGIGLAIFIKSAIMKQSVYRKQALLLVVSALIPFLANMTFNLFDIWPYKSFDITPLTFLVSATLFFYGLFYINLLDILPVARTVLLEEMEDLLIVLDLKKRVLDLNRSSKEELSHHKGSGFDYVGRAIQECFDFWPELVGFIDRPNVENGRIMKVGAAEEDTRYYDARVSDLHDKRGSVSGYMIVIRNITIRERAMREANLAKAEAERANKAKDFFLANMSHEIRTPLNAVIGIAEIMDTSELPRETQKEYISIVLRSANSLLDILNDILDFSKIEAGKMTLEKGSFDIKRVAGDVVEAFSINARNKSISMRLQIGEDMENRFIGDSTRVRQIISNLVGNAVKFTENGEVTLSLKKHGVQEGRALIGITVEDTGIGIPEESREHIFESFKQADSTTTRKYGGSGLGLSIVRDLVELMDGRITLESEAGKGSRFICLIPFEVDTENQQSDGEQKIAERLSMNERGIHRLEGLNVLVAEDNKVNRDIIGIQLKKLGCNFEFAENGKLALEKAVSGTYDMILMDVMMPEMDGIEATMAIRKAEAETGRHIPIVALTAGTMKSDIERCIEAGMDDHTSKPIRRDALISVMLKHCDGTNT